MTAGWRQLWVGPLGRLAFSDGALELSAEFWAILGAVHQNCVLSSGIDQFIFAVR